MKRLASHALSALILSLAGASALAAPQQTVTAPTPINVFYSEEFNGGTFINPANVPFTFTLDPGYQVKWLRFTADVTVSNIPDNFATDLVAEITPPGGAPIFVKLIPESSTSGATFRTSNLRPLEGGLFDSGGVWTVRLSDWFGQDLTGASVEQVVTNLTITAEDPVFAEPAGIIDLGAINASTQVSGSLTPFGIQWYKFTLPRIESMRNEYFDVLVDSISSDNLGLVMLFDDGVDVVNFDDFGATGNRGLLSFGVGGGAQNTRSNASGTFDLPTGTYYLGVVRQPYCLLTDLSFFVPWERNPFNVFTYASGPSSTFTVKFNKGERAPVEPTPVETIVANGPTITRNLSLAPNDIKWYRIDTGPADIAPSTSRFIDISTVSPDPTFVAMNLFDASGRVLKTARSSSTPGAIRSNISLGVGSGADLGIATEIDPNSPAGGLITREAVSAGQSGSIVSGVYYLSLDTGLPAGTEDGFREFFDPEEPSVATTATLTIRNGTRAATAPTSTNLGTLVTSATRNTTIGSGQVRWFRFAVTNDITQASNRHVDIRTTGTARDTSIAVFNASGDLIARDEDDGVDDNAWLSFGIGGSTSLGDGTLGAGRDGDLPAGTYFVAVMPGFSGAGQRFAVAGNADGLSGASTLVVSTGTRSAPQPTPDVDLGVVNSTSASSSVVVPDSGVAFVRFTLSEPVTLASGRFLEVATNVFADGNFPVAAVFDSSGAVRSRLIGGSLSSLRSVFGAGTPVSSLPTLLTTDGSGDLEPGTYTLAIAAPGGDWSTLFETSAAPSLAGGTLNVVVAEGVRPPSLTPAATDLGVLGGPARTETSVLDLTTQVTLYRVTVPQAITRSSGLWLDIDTLGTDADGRGANSASLAIYTTDGRLVARDQRNVPFFQSALSFGSSTPIRPLGGLREVDDTGTGQDGELAAGDYIIGVATLGFFFEDGFAIRQLTRPDDGATLRLNIRTNLPAPITRCNPADIAYDNGDPLPPIGAPGGTNNGVTEGDYNLFFATFFDAGAICDIANDDGSPLPPFGVLTTNNGTTEADYNLFFSIFFDGCSL